MKKIRLSGKHANGAHEYALVDDDIYDRLNAVSWKATPPMAGGHKYAVRNYREGGKHKTAYMHRVIAGNPSGMDVDHINHFSLDNQRANLRIVTRSQNLKNKRPVQVHGVCKGCGRTFVHQEKPSGVEAHTRYCSSDCRPSHEKQSQLKARRKWLDTHSIPTAEAPSIQSMGPSVGVSDTGYFDRQLSLVGERVKG